ncbi:MAG: alternative ribosome rescue aminoacyl-tRNA hydrolase ArfB [Saprospiraceae bacterium]
MIDIAALLKACRFETSRSSGPGGQHVNKTESKVSLYFNIDASNLTREQQIILHQKYPTRINTAGELYMQSYASRSQSANKEAAILKLQSLIDQALVPPKKRYKTKRSKGSIEARLVSKKIHSEKKKNRGGRLNF